MQELTIPYDIFCATMANCIRIGHMQAVKAYEPAADYIRETEVKEWLRMLGIEIKRFKALVEDGTIKKQRHGTSRNSPWFFSKADIVAKLVAADTHTAIINNKH